MPNGITNVTVIGAGTMGSAIAGHLANAGITVTLLDIVPEKLTPEEEDAELTLDHPTVRNRVVQAGFDRMLKARPKNLFDEEVVQHITLGNIDDDLQTAVNDADWIIEAIIERVELKQALMARLEAIASPHTVISTNTSGIPIHIISEGRGDDFKRRFLGTHFFNPPRYLRLLEIIPTTDTDPAVVRRMKEFAENILGKGVVICKDTPNFVANRMISFFQSDIMEFAIENGYTVEEVDRLTGPLLGRPKTATFRLNDIVGIDVLAMVGDNLYDMIPDDEDRNVLRGEYSTAVMRSLIENDILGSKTGQGFYRTVVDEKGRKSFWGLDLQAAAEDGEIDYVEPQKPRWSSVNAARDLPLGERLRSLIEADDQAGDLVWHTLSRTMAYASKRIPEIADSIEDVDNAIKWGFAWEMGPFEIWDALGIRATTARLEGEGIAVAPWVRELLDAGHESFYIFDGADVLVYDPTPKKYVPASSNERALRLASLKRRQIPIGENGSATLLDMGDGIMLLEFHSKMNALDTDIFNLMKVAVERLHGSANGLVIGNEGANFCVGANLMLLGLAAQAGQWDELEKMLRDGQNTLMALRQAPRPVVSAPFQRVLGGGVEVCMASDQVVAHAESYMGLVEVGVGIIPGWGGCKEMVRRNISPHLHATNVIPTPYLRQVFETIGFAKVSLSGIEAKSLGYLSPRDRVIMNNEYLLAEAKRDAIRLLVDGYAPPAVKANVYAAGRDTLASVRVEVYSLLQAGYISEHDATIAGKLGYVLCGGELSAPAWMDEQYFLDLECEAVLSLAGEEKTQERIWYMLQNGRPLRN